MRVGPAHCRRQCLKLMDEVARIGQPLVITKHGKPVAQLVPVPVAPESLFGYMKNTLKVAGDIVAPVDETWSSESGSDDDVYGATRRSPRARRARGRK